MRLSLAWLSPFIPDIAVLVLIYSSSRNSDQVVLDLTLGTRRFVFPLLICSLDFEIIVSLAVISSGRSSYSYIPSTSHALATPLLNSAPGYISKYGFSSVPRLTITRVLCPAFSIYWTFPKDVRPSDLSGMGTPILVFTPRLVEAWPPFSAALVLPFAPDDSARSGS